MTRILRKAAKSEIREALRVRAYGLKLTKKNEEVFAAVQRLRDTHGDQVARRLLSWATGVGLTVLAYHERTGVRTLQNRIDASLDALLEQDTRVP